MGFLITLVGPTAIGKTDLAIQMAQHFSTEIISADSRQIFKEMSIGTAKPSSKDLSLVKHHFINSHSIHEDFSVGQFEKEGLAILTQIFKTNRTAILAGGSGLYVNAITQGFDDLPVAPPSLRKELNDTLSENGITYLQEELQKLDPEYYAEVDIHNPQRLIRALEVYLHTGNKFSALRKNKEKKRPFQIIKIGLKMEREALYERINRRVDLMMEAGLLEEVQTLLPNRHLNALQTVGYQEIFDYLDCKCSLADAVSQIKQNTRRFAKRQMTWFNRDPEINWFEPNQYQSILQFVESQINPA
jgi:tRNA dimethylallyltransferase